MENVKNSRLYKTLCEAVRQEDHAELLRMLELVKDTGSTMWLDETRLVKAFGWSGSPQGAAYWITLYKRLKRAGHDCY